MIYWVADEQVQDYENLATGDHWLIVIREMLYYNGESVVSKIVVSARYRLPVDEISIDTPTPWPGGRITEAYDVATEVPNTRMLIRFEQDCDYTNEEEIRQVKQNLLREVMNIIHLVDAMGEMPETVQQALGMVAEMNEEGDTEREAAD